MKKFNFFIILLSFIFINYSSTYSKTTQYSSQHELRGKASWYGENFNGKLTASGERYNTSEYTAAHKTLPFGMIVKVTNLENNKSVDVKINDRGPFIKGRIIDLSPQAFKQLSSTSKGIVPIKINILDDSRLFRYKH